MSGELGAIGGVIGGLVGGAPGAAVGATIGGGIDKNSAASDAASAANAFSANQYATRYQTTVKDMEAAGLNPMMAYSGISGSPPSGAVAQYTNPYEGASNAYSSVRQADTSASQAEANTRLIDQTVEKVKKETRNLDNEQDRLRAVWVNLAESSALMAQQGATEVSRRENLAAATQKLLADGAISQAEFDAMKRTGFIGVTAREVKVLSDVTSEWVDKFLPWKTGKSTTEEHSEIVRDKDGNVVGGSKYRTTRPK